MTFLRAFLAAFWPIDRIIFDFVLVPAAIAIALFIALHEWLEWLRRIRRRRAVDRALRPALQSSCVGELRSGAAYDQDVA